MHEILCHLVFINEILETSIGFMFKLGVTTIKNVGNFSYSLDLLMATLVWNLSRWMLSFVIIFIINFFNYFLIFVWIPLSRDILTDYFIMISIIEILLWLIVFISQFFKKNPQILFRMSERSSWSRALLRHGLSILFNLKWACIVIVGIYIDEFRWGI